MHNLTLQDLNTITSQANLNLEDYPTFIETGTKKGKTTFLMSNHFNNVITIELDDVLYHKTKQNGEHLKNVTFVHGDSATEIKPIVEQLTTNAIYFLDSHWCGLHTGFGGKDCPLLEELEHIMTSQTKSLIIIDDYRLFGQKRQKPNWTKQEYIDKYGSGGKVEDWTEITDETVMSKVESRLKQHFVIDDRLCLILE